MYFHPFKGETDTKLAVALISTTASTKNSAIPLGGNFLSNGQFFEFSTLVKIIKMDGVRKN